MHNGSFKEVGLSSRSLLEVVLMKDETFTKDYDVLESIHFLNYPLLFWPVRDGSWGMQSMFFPCPPGCQGNLSLLCLSLNHLSVKTCNIVVLLHLRYIPALIIELA